MLGGSGFPETANGRGTQYNDPAVKALFPNLPQRTANTDWNRWAPRLGSAFDLTGKSQTVFRGGFGVFFERIEGNFLSTADPRTLRLGLRLNVYSRADGFVTTSNSPVPPAQSGWAGLTICGRPDSI